MTENIKTQFPTIIWFRHAAKRLDNSDRRDPPTFFNPDTRIFKLRKFLGEHLSGELEIRTSPYLRTRLTSKAFSDDCKVIVDRKLSEFLSSKHTGSFDELTMRYDPPIDESLEDFQHRVAEHLVQVESSKCPVVVCITHGRVITQVAEQLGGDPTQYPKPLAGYVYMNGQLSPFGQFVTLDPKLNPILD